MNTYRISVWHEANFQTANFRNVQVSATPVFVQTNEELDMQDLFSKGLAVKKYVSLPDTDINGNAINIITLE